MPTPLKADDWNTIAARDAAIRSKDRLFGARDERFFPKYTDIQVHNDGETDLKAFTVCGIEGLKTDKDGNVNPDNMIFTGGIFNSDLEENVITYQTSDMLPYDEITELVRTYSAHKYRRIGITREPIPQGTVGRVAIDGEAFAWIEKARAYGNGKSYQDPKPYYFWYLDSGGIKIETRRKIYSTPIYFPFYGARHQRQELSHFSNIGDFIERTVDGYDATWGHSSHEESGKYYGYTLPVLELVAFSDYFTTLDGADVDLAIVRFRTSQEYSSVLAVNNGQLSDK